MEVERCGRNVVNKLESPIMWYAAPKSMTDSEDEEIRHVLGLSDPTSIMIGLEALFNDS